MTLKPLSVYLHFPFCVRKCRYCDFLSFPADETIRDAYLNQLQAEILCLGKLYQKDYEIASIFIGGGTPSLMDSKQLFALVEKLTQIFSVRSDAEISIECNPGTVDAQKLSDYQHIGINRISFGLQSMNDEELQYLGRIHTVKQFLENYEAAKAAGFENINIDLMSSLPDQTVWRWNDTLQKTIALKPNHISAYSLIIEDGTPFGERYADIQPSPQTSSDCFSYDDDFFKQTLRPLPNEDTEQQIDALTRTVLAEHGYNRYEISNYAQKGYECRHNLTYWYRGDYLGMGLGAASMIENCRMTNTRNMQQYMNLFKDSSDTANALINMSPLFEKNTTKSSAPTVPKNDLCKSSPLTKSHLLCTNCDANVLTQQEQIEETMFLGLRCIKGIDTHAFYQIFGRSVYDIYQPIIKKYAAQGLLVDNPSSGRIYLTEAGFNVSNRILADFLLDE